MRVRQDPAWCCAGLGRQGGHSRLHSVRRCLISVLSSAHLLSNQSPLQWDDIPDALPGSSAVVRSFGGASQPSGGSSDGSSSSGASSACTDKQPNGGWKGADGGGSLAHSCWPWAVCHLLAGMLCWARLPASPSCQLDHAPGRNVPPRMPSFPRHPPAADGTTCTQKKSWGQCSEAWMKQADWCAATCEWQSAGVCVSRRRQVPGAPCDVL